MIPDQYRNTVYFSDIIRDDHAYQSAFDRLRTILDKHSIDYRFLSNTEDIWCRDYMPIQINDDEFVQFKYEPSYLDYNPELRSIPQEVLESNGIRAKYSSINLDGGNIVNSKNRAILTNRIFKENPKFDKSELINQIEQLLDTQVLLIPDINTDMTGHSDGHLRFIDSQTILVNELQNELKYWKKGFNKMIKRSGLTYIEMPWFSDRPKHQKNSAVGCYVNYLEIDNLIVFPVFEVYNNRDEEALNVIQSVFPDRIIEPINVNEIGRMGGLLNCISWTIKS